jgi:hypothetical protein
MPWKETCAMDQKMRMIVDHSSKELVMSLCPCKNDDARTSFSILTCHCLLGNYLALLLKGPLP